MDEYIKKSDALNAIGSITMYKGSIPFDTAKYRIEGIPAADVRELVRGKWVDPPTGEQTYCSVCGEDAFIEITEIDEISKFGFTIKSEFCPHCGADMRGDRNDNII